MPRDTKAKNDMMTTVRSARCGGYDPTEVNWDRMAGDLDQPDESGPRRQDPPRAVFARYMMLLLAEVAVVLLAAWFFRSFMM